MDREIRIKDSYRKAKEMLGEWEVDADSALQELERISLSLPCWQGDDVTGFECPKSRLAGGGIQVTGSYPGRARNADELRQDLHQALLLIPGRHRLNLHSIYGEFCGKHIKRNEINLNPFRGWLDWAKQENIKLDFNATCFSHALAASGQTLSHQDKNIRQFWIEHVKNCRLISSFFGRELNSPCIHNLWIPDGMKDAPVDRWGHRQRLRESLDEIFSVKYSKEEMKDALESKLFGIGSESFVVGSHEFYFGYALLKGKMLCMDIGHFHPTESVADKISAVLQFFEELLLHLSRGVRWDSDHVVIWNDELRSLAEEVVRSQTLARTHLAMDFFDASMNRVGAWVIGARATLKAFLSALLQPLERLQTLEKSGDYFGRLALLEELKTTAAVRAIWDFYCLKMEVPPQDLWINEITKYEAEVTSKRD
jgi:L-rhamnose isomerase